MDFTHTSCFLRRLAEKSGEQRYKGNTDEGNTAARHELLHALGLRTGVIVAVTFHEVDNTPDAETCAKGDNEGLENSYCAVEKCHIFYCRNRVGALSEMLFSPNCKSRNGLFHNSHSCRNLPIPASPFTFY